MRMALAVRDPRVARLELEAAARRAARRLAGAVPTFALYLSCAGRGAQFHGAPEAETRLLRDSFGALPTAGLASAFEVAPTAGRATLHLYTGVLALFAAPS
jgi:small ligand-binding sensory domain FIST